MKTQLDEPSRYRRRGKMKTQLDERSRATGVEAKVKTHLDE